MRKEATETIKKRYNRVAPIFNWMDGVMNDKWRSDMLSDLHGEVLEVGVGTGANFIHYPDTIRYTGIDFSPLMLRYARERADKWGKSEHFHLLEMDAEHLEFPDSSFDYVVSTCVYCSVPDPIAGLKEMRRVVKPEGKVLLLEHMRSENKIMGTVMDALNPVTVRLSGANINRKTTENIRQAGFKIETEDHLMGTIMRRLTLAPNK